MAGLFFEEYEVGAVYTTPGRTITEADVVNYAGVSGDYYPLHTDEEFSRKTVFGTRVAHGLLGMSVAFGLAFRLGISEGTTLAFLALEDWRFLGPIKFGDTIHVRMTIVEKRPSSKSGRGIVKRRLSLVNQGGEVVQEGTAVVLVACRPPEIVNKS